MFSLRGYNTFGIEAEARQFVEISSVEEYVSLRKSGLYADLPHLFLGGGSNVLLTKPQEALVVKISIPGISVLKEDVDFVWLKSGAGVVWDELVQVLCKALNFVDICDLHSTQSSLLLYICGFKIFV